MSKTKYAEYFERMVAGNKELFDAFEEIHDKYHVNPEKYQQEFNVIGEKIMLVVAHWENRLCMQSEKGGFGSYTTGLAEKFRNEIRKVYPLIDSVGLKIEKFMLKKINLN